VQVAIKETSLATLAQEAAALALALATPDPVVDVIVKCVDKTLAGRWARCANALGDNDSHTVAGKEGLRRVLTALPVGHPFSTHTHLFPYFWFSQ
jgi:hypothetical protein